MMKQKKHICVLITLIVLINIISSCASSGTNNSKSSYTTWSESTYTTAISSETTTEPTVVETVEFKTVVTYYKDMDGYIYEVTYKLSPWMLYSTKFDLITNMWNQIGKGNELPDLESWRMKSNGNHYEKTINYTSTQSAYFSCDTSNFDMFYCLGTYSVKNVTEGFDINSSNERSFPYDIRLSSPTIYDGSIYQNDNCTCFGGQFSSCSIAKVFFSSGSEFYISSYGILPLGKPKMTKNEWGPVPFVIMHGETSSPQNPNGKYCPILESIGCISCGGMTFEALYEGAAEFSEPENTVEIDVIY